MFILVGVIGVAVAAIFIFRGGGPDSGLTEYFEAVAVLVNDIDDRTGETTVQSPSDNFNQWTFVLTDTAMKLGAIEPPPDAADAHAELVDALGEAGAILADFPDRYSDVESADEARRLISEDEGLLAADARARAACAELQAFADENEIEVELELC